MKASRIVGLALAAILACVTACGTRPTHHLPVRRIDDKYILRYGGMEGAAFTLTTAKTDRYTREIMGTKVSTIALDQTECRCEIESSSDKGSVVGIEYLSRRHETDEPQIEIGPDFSKLIGEKARFTFSRIGELSEFEGFDALPEFEIVDQGQSIGGKRFVNEIREVFVVLPKNPIVIGETWSFTQEYTELIPGGEARITVQCTYELLGEEKRGGFDCLKLGGEFSYVAEGEGSASGIDYVLRLDGEGSDVVHFVVAKGMILSVEGRSTAQGSAKSEELGMAIPMKHEYETRIDVVFE